MGGVKELINHVNFECVWSSDEIYFKKQISIICKKKNIQINNEIHHRVIVDCKDYKTSYSAEYLSICQSPDTIGKWWLAHLNLQSIILSFLGRSVKYFSKCKFCLIFDKLWNENFQIQQRISSGYVHLGDDVQHNFLTHSRLVVSHESHKLLMPMLSSVIFIFFIHGDW